MWQKMLQIGSGSVEPTVVALVPIISSLSDANASNVIYSTQLDYKSDDHCLAYTAFNGINGITIDRDGWISVKNDVVGAYIGYKFPKRVCIKKVYFENNYTSTPNQALKRFVVEGSDTGTTGSWTVICNREFSRSIITSLYGEDYDLSDNNSSYLYYRIRVLESFNTDYVHLAKLQFYGYEV